jgi:hypothetical protein
MPHVVVAGIAGATIQCSHGGTAHLPKGDNRLQISNNPAVTSGQEIGISFMPGAPTVVAPCLHTMPSASGTAPAPCSATQAATAGISALLVIGDAGVLLDNASGLTTNPDPAEQGKAKWSISNAGQTLLSVDH